MSCRTTRNWSWKKIPFRRRRARDCPGLHLHVDGTVLGVGIVCPVKARISSRDLIMPSVNMNPAANSKSSPGVRMVTVSAWPATWMSSGSSPARESFRLREPFHHSTRIRRKIARIAGRTPFRSSLNLTRFSVCPDGNLLNPRTYCKMDSSLSRREGGDRRRGPFGSGLCRHWKSFSISTCTPAWGGPSMLTWSPSDHFAIKGVGTEPLWRGSRSWR